MPFRKRVTGRNDILTLITGIGRRNTEKSFREFLKQNAPGRILTCGFAGGLNPGLKTGEVCFFTEDVTLTPTLMAAGATRARFFCANRIATTVAEKAELRRTSGADAVEMESDAIHSICHERGLSCATVRVISDTAAEDLPLDFNQLAKVDLNLDYGKLAWAIAKSPRKIPALLKLQRQTRMAAENLAAVLLKVI